MAHPIVECIPNFSEGRRSEVVDQIAAAITSIQGVTLLDRHSDPDHNRTVLTMLGAPDQVKEAAFNAIRKAAELIDMDQHQGEHPRIGATDVVPFVPIRDMGMEDCILLARTLGKQVGEELGIPVYLYEAAASSPERVNLEDVRRGQYEGLKEEVLSNPQRQPDFGPARLGKAGATVIGAREPLVAFNVYLATDDVEIARKIARTIRFSSGGLRYVKAMGVLVNGKAQVSMNLTNFHKTSIALVVENVRREAQRYGASIHHSELVGLVPQEALVDAAVWYTQMDGFEPSQILEYKLQQEPESNIPQSHYPFLDDLASAQPTPGGGSAAAFSAAEAAALVGMVARLTVGKKKYADVESEMYRVIEQADSLRRQLTEAISLDAAAFEGVMQALKLPKDSEEQIKIRQEAISSASIRAAEVPLKTAEMTLEVMKLAEIVASRGNTNAITDAGTAASLAFAAASSAGANVRINLSDLKENEMARDLDQRLSEVEDQIKTLRDGVKSIIKNRANIELL